MASRRSREAVAQTNTSVPQETQRRIFDDNFVYLLLAPTKRLPERLRQSRRNRAAYTDGTRMPVGSRLINHEAQDCRSHVRVCLEVFAASFYFVKTNYCP